MNWTIEFVFRSLLLGVGLAMDAFSVSMANGLREPEMHSSRMTIIAGTFALFQFLMPMIGWLCVHTIAQYFIAFQKAVPWIGFALLLWIGGKMLYEGIRGGEEAETESMGARMLILQGIATSIDALSVGFTISEYNLAMALVSALLIAVVTFVICFAGVLIGRKFGTKLSGKASILGGCILILIGIRMVLHQ